MILCFQRYCVSFKQALAVNSFFICTELIHKSSCSHPFDELPFFYYKRVIAATHSFKFTMFLKSSHFSKGILTIILIPPWFQACIYWKKFVILRHQLQPSIFSMIVSLFHGSTWSNPHVKETVFISQYFLQPSIIINGLRLIRKKVEEYVYLRKTIVACCFKDGYLFHRTSCSNLCLKICEMHKSTYRDPTFSWWTSIAKLPSFFQKK